MGIRKSNHPPHGARRRVHRERRAVLTSLSKQERRHRERGAGRIGRAEQQGRAAGRAPAPARLAYTALVFMAPWLPPIVVYCPPAQQCSAVAPPAPPRPHPRLRPVPSPLPLPPLLPPAPSSPQGFPRHQFVGEKGGRSRGVRSGFPALGRAGGRFRRLRYGPAHVRHTWARLPAWLYKPCATLSRRFLLSEERPVRRAPAGRNATPLCARRTA